jgi:hypothetical protein
MKIYSTSLIIGEIQIKTTMRYDFTSVKMAIIKSKQNKNKITSAGKNVVKLEPLCIVRGNIK